MTRRRSSPEAEAIIRNSRAAQAKIVSMSEQEKQALADRLVSPCHPDAGIKMDYNYGYPPSERLRCGQVWCDNRWDYSGQVSYYGGMSHEDPPPLETQ